MIKIYSVINNTNPVINKTIKAQNIKTPPILNDEFMNNHYNTKAIGLLAKLRKFLGFRKKLVPTSFVETNFDVSKPYAQSKYASILSKNYLEYHYLSQNDKIIDGFKDAGRASKIDATGEFINPGREIITIDRENDVYLKNAINYAKKNTKNLSDKKKMKFIFNMVNDLGGDAEKGLELSAIVADKLKGREVLLGKLFENEATCCRHKALMFKILGDEVGLKTRMLRGHLLDTKGVYGHTWNEVMINDKRYVVDVENRFISKTNTDNVLKMLILRDYLSVKGKFFY